MTPSKRRRQGKRAFDPGLSPLRECPYGKDAWNEHRGDWLEGWGLAKLEYELSRTRLNDIELNQLATYNSEVSRGIMHTREWKEEMDNLQDMFNR